MDKVMIVTEGEIKAWITEAVHEAMKPRIADPEIPIPEDQLLTRPEAAKLLRINVCTLTQWTKSGLPHYRKRGRVYYARSELLLYMKQTHSGFLKYSDKYVGMEER